MASHTLYPAIVDSYMPAFQVFPGENNICTVLFSLSRFTSSSDIKEVHISVTKQGSGLNMVNSLTNSENRFRNTGIILVDGALSSVGDNLYSINIYDEDLNSVSGSYQGWIPGDLYKVQLRLSFVAYNEREDTDMTQSEWLNTQAGQFSEWSTVCTVKPIGDIKITTPTFSYSGTNPSTVNVGDYSSTTLEFVGDIESVQDTSEVLYCYRVKLYEGSSLLEDSGDIITKNYQNVNKFNYLFKTELTDLTNYSLVFSYETNNNFSSIVTFNFPVTISYGNSIDAYVATIENDVDDVMFGLTTVSKEEDEGRIGLKLFSNESDNFTGTVIIRRTDSKSNFTIWEDIKEVEYSDVDLNDIGLFYDYTVESGIWYLYGLQVILSDTRSPLLFPQDSGVDVKNPSLRNFEYSFLLGENNQQLKLKFDNTMGNYKIQQMESKFETIGNRFPYTSRNAALNYKLFPINGLISYMMDDNKLFCDKKVIYTYDDIVDLYKDYESSNRITYNNNYIYERDFRNKVIEFLINGRPKIFKSPTEGNVIVRLMEVNFVPNQSLDRMIYSFTSNGNEIAESNIDNYVKYNFLDLYSIKSEEANADAGHVHNTADVEDSPVRNYNY